MYETMKCQNMKILEHISHSEVTKFHHDSIAWGKSATHKIAFLLSNFTCSNDTEMGYIQC